MRPKGEKRSEDKAEEFLQLPDGKFVFERDYEWALIEYLVDKEK